MQLRVRAAGLLLLLCVVWGCGGSDYGGPSNPSGPSSPGGGGGSDSPPVVIDIVGSRGTQSFSPNPAAVPEGRMVVWRNMDVEVHRVRLDDLSIDTGNIPPGATSQPVDVGTATKPYHCPLHPGMVGSLNGTAGGQQPPACDPGQAYC
jgi:plastocyanin